MNNVDLSALRIDDSGAKVPRRPLGPRLLAFAALALVLGVAATFVWPLLRPARAVRMAAVRAAAATTEASVPIAEAVGWVEADPFPVIVRPLVAGRIESIERAGSEFKEILIRPAVEFSSLEEVLVVMTRPPAAEAELELGSQRAAGPPQ